MDPDSHMLDGEVTRLLAALEQDKQQQTQDADETRRQIARLLYDRQKQALQLLDCLRAESCPDGTVRKHALPVCVWPASGAAIALIIAAVLSLQSGSLLNALADGSTAALLSLSRQMTWQTILLLLALVLILISLALLISGTLHKRKTALKPPPAVILTDPVRLQQTTDTLRTGLQVDLQAIAALMQVENVARDSGQQKSASELFTALYELQVDAPRDKRLVWAVSVSRDLLTASGLEAVDYSPEQAGLFDVIPVDCDSQQRYPAVVRAEDGLLVRRGYYIQKT